MALVYRDRGSSGTQLDIVCGTLVIGTLWKAVLSATSGGAVTWRWTFHMTAMPRGHFQHGSADTFEEAKEEVERNWRMWCAAAGLGEIS